MLSIPLNETGSVVPIGDSALALLKGSTAAAAARSRDQRGPACWPGSSSTRFADYRLDDREKVGGVDRFRQKMVPAARAGREIRDMAGHDHRRGSEPRCAVGQ